MRLKAVFLATMLLLPVSMTSHQEAVAGQTLAGLFGSKKPKFLPVNQAFQVSPSQMGDTLTVRFGVRDGHYIYKDKLALKLPDGVTAGAWQFDKPSTMVDDPDFGKVAVFEEDVVASVKLTSPQAVSETATLTWQGCAKAGLCYPPERVSVRLDLAGNGASDNKTVSNTSKANGNIAQTSADKSTQEPNAQNQANTAPTKTSQDKDNLNKETPNQDNTAKENTDKASQAVNFQNQGVQNQDKTQDTSTNGDVTTLTPNAETDGEQDVINNADQDAIGHLINTNALPTENLTTQTTPTQNPPRDLMANDASTTSAFALNHAPQNTSTVGGFGLDKNPVLGVVLLFLAGLVLAFTACVYPMIPIVANIVAKSHNPSAGRGFALTSAYGLGVATSYGVLGAVVAWFGQSLGILGYLQNPYILGGFALFFVLLALQMWGVINLSLPSKLKQKLSQGSQSADRHLGSVYGSFLVGALSALVVSPCVSAPLAGALWAVSVQGNVVLGFVALFALGAGLSLPLVVIGTTQGRFMPKAGAFMERVKEFGGLMLIAVAILLANRVFLTSFMLVVWAVWFMAVAVFFYRLGKLPFKAVGLVAGLWSALLVAGASLGGTDAWQPLASLTAKNSQNIQKPDIKIYTLAELDDVLARTPNVVVDLTADWCIECKIMEKTLFTSRPPALANWQVVKLDITDTTDDSRAVLARYELFGPPALLYYKNGQLVQKQVGEVSRSDFEMVLATP